MPDISMCQLPCPKSATCKRSPECVDPDMEWQSWICLPEDHDVNNCTYYYQWPSRADRAYTEMVQLNQDMGLYD